MLDIVSLLPSKRKLTTTGWITFNGPCCVRRGESQDKRMRSGIKEVESGVWAIHCYNCGFSTTIRIGEALTNTTRKYFGWLGLDEKQIQILNLQSLKQKSLIQSLGDVKIELPAVKFTPIEVPSSYELITEKEHPDKFDYIRKRGFDLRYPFMTEPSNKRDNIIIPLSCQDGIVGFSHRFIDGKRPKYVRSAPSGYVFGTDWQNHKWKYAFVCEGEFKALSIDGLSVQSNQITEKQARVIASLNKTPIIVPDSHRSGVALIDRGIELGYAVSFPKWDSDIKDVDDAVLRYGKLATIVHILQETEFSKIKIQIKRRQFVNRVQH